MISKLDRFLSEKPDFKGSRIKIHPQKPTPNGVFTLGNQGIQGEFDFGRPSDRGKSLISDQPPQTSIPH